MGYKNRSRSRTNLSQNIESYQSIDSFWKKWYLILVHETVVDLVFDGDEEEDVVHEVGVSSPGGHPHDVVGDGLLRVVDSLNDDVKVFVLEKSGCLC